MAFSDDRFATVVSIMDAKIDPLREDKNKISMVTIVYEVKIQFSKTVWFELKFVYNIIL